jgi:hypothetical protein
MDDLVIIEKILDLNQLVILACNNNIIVIASLISPF